MPSSLDPSAIHLVPYSPSDEADLRRAIGELHDHVVALDPIRRLRHEPGYISHEHTSTLDVVERQNGRIFVARTDAGRFVGFVAGFVTQQSAENLLSVVPTQLGVISDVYVVVEWRGRSVGERLLRCMEDYLKAAGCDALWITVSAFNTGAARFYAQQGYTEREVGLLKSLS